MIEHKTQLLSTQQKFLADEKLNLLYQSIKESSRSSMHNNSSKKQQTIKISEETLLSNTYSGIPQLDLKNLGHCNDSYDF